MKSVMFNLPAEELDLRLLESIKLLFKGKQLKIIVSEDIPEAPEKSLHEIIAENKKSPYVYQLSAESFSGIADQFVAEEEFDVLAAFEKFKTVRP